MIKASCECWPKQCLCPQDNMSLGSDKARVTADKEVVVLVVQSSLDDANEILGVGDSKDVLRHDARQSESLDCNVDRCQF